MSEISRVYLEEALKAIKELLPGWQYAVIRQAALPRAGARGRHETKPPGSMVQTLIFDKEKFDEVKAKAWAKDHGFHFGGLDETGTSFRARQENPGKFQQMRTIEITDGVKAVIGFNGSRKQAIAKQSAIVGLFLPPVVAEELAIEGGELPSEMHVTLCHLGDALNLSAGAHEVLFRRLATILADQPLLQGTVSGVGRFDPAEDDPEGEAVYYASVDVPGLAELRALVCQACEECGIAVSQAHGFDPHVTLAYAPKGLEVELPEVERLPLMFDAVTLALGPVRLNVPFGAELPDLEEAAGWLHEAGAMAGEGPAQEAVFQAARALLGASGADGMRKAQWSTAYVNELPDDAFLFIAPGGEKDESGKTVPRSLRSLPVRDAEGNLSAPHLRNALARLSQVEGLSPDDQKTIRERAKAMLEETKKGAAPTAWLLAEKDCSTCKAQNEGACRPDINKGCRFCKADLPPGTLGTWGNPGAAVLFVGSAPRPIDVARGEPLAGATGAAFRDEYLARLGLTKAEIAITHLVPEPERFGQPSSEQVKKWAAWMRREIARMRPGAVVALGGVAKAALGDLADFALPHPSALQKGDTRGELQRKVVLIKRRLTERLAAGTPTGKARSDSNPMTRGSSPHPSQSSDADTQASSDETRERRVAVAKADRAKQVVYGVVLDPYSVDTQNDWSPPAEIEDAAHRWLTESRVIGLNHEGVAKARVVESFMVPYPSPEDYQAAMSNQPHKAMRIKLGEQNVGSGAWVLGVKIDDPQTWTDVETGKLDAFSIGGYSQRTPTTRAAMPRVEFTRA